MTNSDPSDPRLLLPNWLRDPVVEEESTMLPVDRSAPRGERKRTTRNDGPKPAPDFLPFSTRLAVDRVFDPSMLISADDLPRWLSGHTREAQAIPGHGIRNVEHAATHAPLSPESPSADESESLGETAAMREAEPNVVQVELSGWYLVLAAIGLLILVAGALRLFLS
jgi:hypothetical protein